MEPSGVGLPAKRAPLAESGAESVRADRPVPLVVVVKFIHRAFAVVHQSNGFAVVGETPGEGAQRPLAAKSRVGGVGSNKEVSVTRNDRALWKTVCNSTP